MWKFSNLSSGYAIWPPDSRHQQKLNSLIYPANANPYGFFVGNFTCPIPAFGPQGNSCQFDSVFIPSSNPQALHPSTNCSTKKFLVFDQSGDQTSLIFSSVANPYHVLTPNFPASNATYGHPSNGGGSEELEVMHEDTEEIDALLYSESEYADEAEEASTGHSPLAMEGDEEIAGSHIPAKRRKLDLSDPDESLVDTASSASACSPHCCSPDGGDAVLNYVDNSIGEEEGKTGSKSKREKRERIQMTVRMLRKIIPGGEGKDAAAVLDEAIRYLKCLKLQAKEALGATNTTTTTTTTTTTRL